MTIGSAFQMVGGIVGGPWGMAIAIAGSAIDYAMTPAQQVGKLDDKNMLITSYGQPIQKFWGTARVSGVAIWSTELEENRERNKGKGGGGGKQDVYTYKGNLAIAVNDNPVTAYLDIIKDSKELIYTANKNASKQSLISSLDFAEALRFYYADVNQRPDPFIQSVEGRGKTPAYRDLSYFVIEGFETKTPYSPSFEVVATTSSTKQYVHHEIYNANTVNLGIASTNIITKDFNRYFVINRDKQNEFTFSNYFVDSNGAKESLASTTFKKTYYNNLGQAINFLGFSVCRTAKSNGQTIYLGLTNSGGYYLFKTTEQPIDIDSGAKNLSNVLYLNKNNKEYIYFEQDNIPKINNKTVDFIVRDWDCSHDYVYISTYNKIIKYSDSETPITLYHNTSTPATTNGVVSQVCVINDDLLYFTEKSASNLILKKIENGVVSTLRSFNERATSTANYFYTENGENLLFISNYSTYGGGQTRSVFLNTPTYEGATVKLSSIVLDLIKIAKSGEDEFLQDINIEDIDILELNDDVKGFVIKNETTARDALEKLAQCFFFEAKNSNGKLIFVKRGKAPIKTITQDDLSARQGTSSESVEDFLSIERAHDSQLFNEIRVNFIDITADFKLNSQYERRQGTNSVNSKTFDLDVAMTPNEARTIATKILDSYWKCRTEYKFKISLKHTDLEPCDVINLNVFGNIYTMRIVKLHAQNGVIDVTAISEDPAIYLQKSVGATINKTINSEVAIAPATNFQLLDIPYLRDQDSKISGVYVACGPHVKSSKWRGCSLLKSLDLGTSFGNLKDYTTPATMGFTINKLGDFNNSGLIDNINYVTVKTNGVEDLLSVDFNSLLNGANTALIGNEIIQFMYASAVTSDTYNLYGLLRGCRGTEYAMSTHKEEDRFVLLTTDSIEYLPLSSADFDVEAIYKAVSFGSYASKTAPFNFNYQGQAYECYSPFQVFGGFHSQGATLKWVRRAKTNNSWNNFVDVPIDEPSLNFEVEILKDDNVIRIITTQTTTIEYSNEQIIQDFTTKPTTINFRVYQVGALRGKGNVGLGVIK